MESAELDPSCIVAPDKEGPGTVQEWIKDPGVRLVLEVFNGEVTDVRTG